MTGGDACLPVLVKILALAVEEVPFEKSLRETGLRACLPRKAAEPSDFGFAE
jgi:hypothetical protein